MTQRSVRSPRWMKAGLCFLAMSCFSLTPVFAQCTLNGAPTTPPCTLDGPVTINTYNDSTSNDVTTTSGTLTNSGSMNIQGALELVGDTGLTGPGTLTLNAGQIGTNSAGYTLTNAGNVVGSGIIGSNNATWQNLSLNNSGAITANSAGNTLSVQGSGGSVINSGTFAASGGGLLLLATNAAIANNGGSITSSGTGSNVTVQTSIQGGTLATSNGGVMQTSTAGATLDGSANAITLTDGSTYTAGAAGTGTLTVVNGTLNLGTATGSTLALGGALELVGNTTINTPGAGSITMNQGQIGTNNNGYTLTNTGLIQGSGVIGSTSATWGNLNLTNAGTINANVPLALTIAGTGSSIINGGTFEATAGGTLNLATQSAAVNNQNGIILAADGSTVNITGTIHGGALTIQGGTLTTQGTGVMQSSGTATLDAATLGAITLTDGSTYTSGAGSITNITGQLNLGTATGSTLTVSGTDVNPGYLVLVGNTTLAGPGSVVLNGGLIGNNGAGFTLTNNSTIQGYGVIGSNAGADFGNLNLSNGGTINANSTGNTLSVQGTGGLIVNTGLIEATNGGTLLFATAAPVNNAGGAITAADGSTVNVNTTIQGGTLNSTGSGVMQTLAGNTATLDGQNQGAITISDGSIYSSGSSSITRVLGQINLGVSTGSTLALSGDLQLVGNTTFAGPGSVTMSGNAQIGTDGNGYLLTNNSTIQGNGLIGSNLGALSSNNSIANGGSIISNGGTLSLAGSGTLTNSGTLQANAGTTLVSTMTGNGNGLSSSTFSGNTLLTGTYVINSTATQAGTIQLTAIGQNGGEVVNNAATIVLNGPQSSFVDGGGKSILSAFSNNLAGGNFTIENTGTYAGDSFTSASPFSNAGTVTVGVNTTFFTGPDGIGGSYTQTDGTTTVDGTLVATGGVTIAGGTLQGAGGTIEGDVSNGGTFNAGEDPTTFNIAGDYTQLAAGLLNLDLFTSTDSDRLVVTGAANLAGTLDISTLAGFTAFDGETFDILNASTLNGTTFTTVNGLNLSNGFYFTVDYNATNVELVVGGGNSAPAAPEPGTWLMLAGGLGFLTFVHIRRQRRKA